MMYLALTTILCNVHLEVYFFFATLELFAL